MPSIARRLDIGGRPPLGCGLSGGRSGSIRCQSSSGMRQLSSTACSILRRATTTIADLLLDLPGLELSERGVSNQRTADHGFRIGSSPTAAVGGYT
jgi:hypothetical protein